MTTKKESLDRRRDVRSVKQFKEDIKWSSDREKHLMKLFAREMRYRGHTIKYENNGVDNSGEFVEFSNNQPDYKVTIDGKEQLVEIKANPYHHKQTFKTYDIEAYIKYKAYILLFYNIGHNKTVVSPDTKWGLIDTKSLEKIYKDVEARRGDAKWGFKPVLIIYPKDYSKYWKEEEITCQD